MNDHASTPMIELVDVHKRLGAREVLKGVSLRIGRGETFCIIGRSGTGKSVTLKHIVGLLQPDRGQVFVDGKEISRAPEREIDEARKKMGVLFQNGALINWMDVGDNVALPLTQHERHLAPEEVSRRVAECLEMVELRGVERLMPDNLSGGMRKRVGLARAIVREPKIILYDEPTSGLDPVTGSQIDALIVSLKERLGVTSIVVTHDMMSAYHVADRIAMLYDGEVIEEGPPDRIRNTANPFVRQFITGDVHGPITGVYEPETSGPAPASK